MSKVDLLYKLFSVMKVFPCNKCGIYLLSQRFCEKCIQHMEEEYELIIQLAEKNQKNDKED